MERSNQFSLDCAEQEINIDFIKTPGSKDGLKLRGWAGLENRDSVGGGVGSWSGKPLTPKGNPRFPPDPRRGRDA